MPLECVSSALINIPFRPTCIHGNPALSFPEPRLVAGMRVFQRGANYIRKLDSLHRLALDMLCIINLNSNRDIHPFDQNMLMNLSMALCNSDMCSNVNDTFRLLSFTSIFNSSLCGWFFACFCFVPCVWLFICLYMYCKHMHICMFVCVYKFKYVSN